MTFRDGNQADQFQEIPDPFSDVTADGAVRRPDLGVRAPTRTERQWAQFFALVGSVSWVTVLTLVLGLRADLGQLPLAFVLVEIALPALLAGATVVAAGHPGAMGLGVRRGMAWVVGTAAIATFALGAALGPLLHPGAHFGGALSGFFVCAALTSLLAAIPLVAIALGVRHAYPVGASWRAGLLALGAGLFAGAAINAKCEDTHVLHVSLGHGMPIIAALAIGALLLARFARA